MEGAQAWALGLTKAFGFSYLEMLARYVGIAGIAYGVFYVWRRRSFQARRIQPAFPERLRMRAEFRRSLVSIGVFGLTGLAMVVAGHFGKTKIYFDVDEYGWAWFAGSVVVMLVWHDTWFYWTHRFMHLGRIYARVHRVHHLSTNPSPWAAFSFHPIEAAIHSFAIPLLALVMPVHVNALFVWVLAMTTMNVLGHLGYEVFPSGWTTRWPTRLHNTSTHHNLHHQHFHCNYSLYYNWWDRIMGTNHARYHEEFEAIHARRNATAASTAGGSAAQPLPT